MRYVVTAEEMRALDAATIEELGLPGAVLMENAGRAVASEVRDMLPDRAHVAVCCGAGNNGGDGYVIARCLREWGVGATVYLTVPADAVRGDAKLHFGVFEQCGGHVAAIHDEATLVEHAPAIEGADVVVDALFGTGLAREVTGHFAEVIRVMNRSRGHRVAVDIPSGVSANSGEVLGVSVAADKTVTFGFSKPGLVCAPGYARCGEVIVAEIGIPNDLARAHAVQLAVVEADDVTGWLPPRGQLDHKATRGHVLLVGGSPGKRGAGRMAARGALRAGAGLVTLATAGDDVRAPDEVMTADLDADAAGAGDVLVRLAAGKRGVAIGPGMPASEGGRALVLGALATLDSTLVLDADALNHLGQELEPVASAQVPVILTPHPGEAARLLGTSAAEVERDRVGSIRELARRSKAVVVLKGARTLVCDGGIDDPFVTVNPTGNPGMASAGTGDVLTGVITALVGQGVAPVDAARAGAFLHGLAGDIAAEAGGQTGLIAGDLIDALPQALEALENA
jgi:NAD(P)H-hydrate epimerase